MPRLHKIVTRHSQHASGPVSLIWWRRVHVQTAGRTGRTAHQSPIQLRCEQRAAYVSPGPLMPPGFWLQIAFLKLFIVYLKTSKKYCPARCSSQTLGSQSWRISFPFSSWFAQGQPCNISTPNNGPRSTYDSLVLNHWRKSRTVILKMCPWLFFGVSVSKVKQNRTHGFTFRPALNNELGPGKAVSRSAKPSSPWEFMGPNQLPMAVATSTSLVWFVGVVVCWYGFLGLLIIYTSNSVYTLCL